MMTYINSMMKIQDDELITSWLEVLASNNNFDVREFITDFKKNRNNFYKTLVRKDYLTSIEFFCEKYEKRGFPSVTDIMKKHTDFYACMPFRKRGANVLLSESMLRTKREKRLFSDMIVRSEVEEYKICPLCMAEDIKKCYRPYVHVWHNLPGVTCCQKHECKLINIESNNREVVGAEENEIKMAKFMYQSYKNPCYGHVKQTLLALGMYDLSLSQINKITCTQIIQKIVENYTYTEFFEKMEKVTEELILKKVCKKCGTQYYIFKDAEEIGFGCPKCDMLDEFVTLAKRFVENNEDGKYKLVDCLTTESHKKRIKMLHESCGRVLNQEISVFIRDGYVCPKCCGNKTGEMSIARNGQEMKIVRYENNLDIDVQFEDGTIVKNRDYAGFRRGTIKNPNFDGYIKKYREGETNISTFGQKMTIIRYRGNLDIDVQFEDGTIVKNRTYDNFQRGTIKNHNYKGCKNTSRIGETIIASNGQEMTIVGYRGYADIDVQFEDNTIVLNKSYSSFKKGKIMNPNHQISKKIDRTGETTISTQGQKMTIIRYGHNADIDVIFEDGTIVKNKTYLHFHEGKIKNPNYIVKLDKEKE